MMLSKIQVIFLLLEVTGLFQCDFKAMKMEGMFYLSIAFLYRVNLSPQVISARSEDQGPDSWQHLTVQLFVCAHGQSYHTQAGNLHSYLIYACEEEENTRIEMYWTAKSIMVNSNALFEMLRDFSLKYCEIVYCLCAICLFSQTALALVKLLKCLQA